MSSSPQQIDMHIERLHIEPGDFVVVELLTEATIDVCDAIKFSLSAHLPQGTPVFIHDARVMRISVMQAPVPAMLQ